MLDRNVSDCLNIDDDLMCEMVRNGDEYAVKALIDRYLPVVKAIAGRYHTVGIDFDDLLQEGMIGIFKAVVGFDKTKNVPFDFFVRKCIKNEMCDAVKASERKKHSPLNNSISFGEPVFEQALHTGCFDSAYGDPEGLVIDKEDEDEIEQVLEGLLSTFEKMVLKTYLDGNSYKETALAVNRDSKSVGNAIARIRRKLSTYYSIGDFR